MYNLADLLIKDIEDDLDPPAISLYKERLLHVGKLLKLYSAELEDIINHGKWSFVT